MVAESGLAAMRASAAVLGGELLVTSRPGAGTVVSAWLGPRPNDGEGPAAEGPPAVPPVPGSARLRLVTDARPGSPPGPGGDTGGGPAPGTGSRLGPGVDGPPGPLTRRRCPGLRCPGRRGRRAQLEEDRAQLDELVDARAAVGRLQGPVGDQPRRWWRRSPWCRRGRARRRAWRRGAPPAVPPACDPGCGARRARPRWCRRPCRAWPCEPGLGTGRASCARWGLGGSGRSGALRGAHRSGNAPAAARRTHHLPGPGAPGRGARPAGRPPRARGADGGHRAARPQPGRPPRPAHGGDARRAHRGRGPAGRGGDQGAWCARCSRARPR